MFSRKNIFLIQLYLLLIILSINNCLSEFENDIFIGSMYTIINNENPEYYIDLLNKQNKNTIGPNMKNSIHSYMSYACCAAPSALHNKKFDHPLRETARDCGYKVWDAISYNTEADPPNCKWYDAVIDTGVVIEVDYVNNQHNLPPPNMGKVCMVFHSKDMMTDSYNHHPQMTGLGEEGLFGGNNGTKSLPRAMIIKGDRYHYNDECDPNNYEADGLYILMNKINDDGTSTLSCINTGLNIDKTVESKTVQCWDAEKNEYGIHYTNTKGDFYKKIFTGVPISPLTKFTRSCGEWFTGSSSEIYHLSVFSFGQLDDVTKPKKHSLNIKCYRNTDLELKYNNPNKDNVQVYINYNKENDKCYKTTNTDETFIITPEDCGVINELENGILTVKGSLLVEKPMKIYKFDFECKFDRNIESDSNKIDVSKQIYHEANVTNSSSPININVFLTNEKGFQINNNNKVDHGDKLRICVKVDNHKHNKINLDNIVFNYIKAIPSEKGFQYGLNESYIINNGYFTNDNLFVDNSIKNEDIRCISYMNALHGYEKVEVQGHICFNHLNCEKTLTTENYKNTVTRRLISYIKNTRLGRLLSQNKESNNSISIYTNTSYPMVNNKEDKEEPEPDPKPEPNKLSLSDMAILYISSAIAICSCACSCSYAITKIRGSARIHHGNDRYRSNDNDIEIGGQNNPNNTILSSRRNIPPPSTPSTNNNINSNVVVVGQHEEGFDVIGETLPTTKGNKSGKIPIATNIKKSLY